MKKIYKAFTLPEVLLALLILGVIAAMTIMVLIPDTKGKEKIVKIQRAYSILSNSYENISTKFGPIIDWGIIDSEIVGDMISKGMLLAENCRTRTDLTSVNNCVPGCPKLYKTTGERLDVCTSSDVFKLMTNDGFSYAFQIESQNCSIDVTNNAPRAPFALKQVCGTVMTDIYAKKKGNNHNLYGADLFLFYITREGLIPAGLADDNTFPGDETKCKKRITEDIPGCTAIYIYNKNKIDE